MREREPDKSRFSGPAPPERKKKTGYYQRFAKEDASGPEAVSSSSRYEPQPNREGQTFDQVKRPPDVSPSEWRQEAPERPTHAEEPGRLHFTPSDELNKEAGDLPHDNRQHGSGYARRLPTRAGRRRAASPPACTSPRRNAHQSRPGRNHPVAQAAARPAPPTTPKAAMPTSGARPNAPGPRLTGQTPSWKRPVTSSQHGGASG